MTTSLPRRPVSRSSPGVSRNASTAASSANASRSCRPGADFLRPGHRRGRPRSWMRSARPTRVARRARHTVTQTTASAVAARTDTVRCRVTRRVRRSNDSGMRRSNATARTRAATARMIASVPTDRVAKKLDRRAEVAPVGHRVERPVERHEEAHVQDLHDGQHAEKHPDQCRHDPSGPHRKHEHQGDDDKPLDRDANEGGRCEPTDLVGCHQSEPHEQARQDRDQRGGDDAKSASAANEVGLGSQRHKTSVGVDSPPAPRRRFVDAARHPIGPRGQHGTLIRPQSFAAGLDAAAIAPTVAGKWGEP